MGTADDPYAGVFYNDSPDGLEALWGYNLTDRGTVSAALIGGQSGIMHRGHGRRLDLPGLGVSRVPMDNRANPELINMRFAYVAVLSRPA